MGYVETYIQRGFKILHRSRNQIKNKLQINQNMEVMGIKQHTQETKYLTLPI